MQLTPTQNRIFRLFRSKPVTTKVKADTPVDRVTLSDRARSLFSTKNLGFKITGALAATAIGTAIAGLTPVAIGCAVLGFGALAGSVANLLMDDGSRATSYNRSDHQQWGIAGR